MTMTVSTDLTAGRWLVQHMADLVGIAPCDWLIDVRDEGFRVIENYGHTDLCMAQLRALSYRLVDLDARSFEHVWQQGRFWESNVQPDGCDPWRYESEVMRGCAWRILRDLYVSSAPF